MAIENTGIYEIRNIHNGNRYIGSAVRIANRWLDHRRSLGRGNHHAIALQRAWNKYGESAFEFSKLLICSKENLIMYEQAFFDFYKPAYNSAPIAGSQLGYRHTEESRKKMSASNRRLKPNLGRKFSPEHAAKISATKTGVKLGAYSPDRIAKTAKAMRESKGALTEDQVQVIRRMKSDGYKHQDVADVVGCSYWAVADIARSRTYKWLI